MSTNVEGICARCGTRRGDFRDICTSCGHRPAEEGLLIAWLLSADYLSAHKMDVAAERIKTGEMVRPSSRMLDEARLALGRHYTTDPGMTVWQRLLLLTTSLLLTPLVGWVLWFWWRGQRPRASLQALFLSAPASILFFVAVIWLWI